MRLIESHQVGVCIYCGSRDQLTDEHVLPQGLGGVVVLRKGSCEVCRLKIHPFETRFLRNVLGPLRHGRGMRSKNRGKAKGPRGAWVTIQRADGTRFKQFVEAKDLPKFSFKLPRYYFPPYFMVPPKATDKPLMRREIQTAIDRGDAEHQLKTLGGIIDLECDEDSICRTLAKISHGIATAALGVDGWDPFLRDYAVGGELPGAVEDYIGSQFAFHIDGADKAPEDANMIYITLGLFPSPHDKEERIVFLNIHILPNIGQVRGHWERIPYYGVVAGKCSNEKSRIFQEQASR